MLTLTLLGSYLLHIADAEDEDGSTAEVIDLNKLLGNHNGSFDSAGVRFSVTASNVALRGWVLCAELRDLQGRWKNDEIAILPRTSPSSGDAKYELLFDKSYLGLEQGWSHNVPFAVPTVSSPDDCQNARLVCPSTVARVVALCRVALSDGLNVKGEYQKREIDLKPLLGSRDGHFDEGGTNFTDSARNVRIVGTTLTAELRTSSQQWRQDSIDLARLIVCKDGQLQAVKAERQAVDTTETLQETTENLDMLFENVSAASIRLYTPLSKSENTLRLCYVLPGTWHESLRCCMVTERMGRTQYRCLSYCWGPADATEFISINGHSVPVRKNLTTALRHIRARNMQSAIWIDAICINQEDNSEKSEQVSRMADIFSGALEVFIWLGEDCEITPTVSSDAFSELNGRNVLIDFLDCIGTRQYLGNIWDLTAILIRADGTMAYGGHTNRLARAVENFLKAEWFTRAWTIQELLLTEHATVLYHRSAIRWRILQDAHKLVDSYFRGSHGNLAADKQVDIFKPLISALRQLVERFWLFRYMKLEYDRTRRPENDLPASRRENALLLLQKCRSQKSSDPRDKLFAFYSIAKATFGELGPDYSLEPLDLYQAFTFAHIMETGCFDIWALKEGESEEQPVSAVPDLPSWVIDWSRPATASLEPQFRYRYRQDQTEATVTQKSQLPLARLTCGSLLVMGCELGQVVEVTNTVYTGYSLNSQVEWDSVSWEEHRTTLWDWTRFLSPMFGPGAAEYFVMLNHLWKLMVGDGRHYSVSDGTPLKAPCENENSLGILQNEDDFRIWWTGHLCKWPGHRAHIRPGHIFVEDKDPILSRGRIRAEDRRLCILSRDGIGLVPRQCRPHDRIFSIQGSRWPIVLRPDDTASPKQSQSGKYKLVGPCLVYFPNLDQERSAPEYLSEIIIN